MQGNSASTRPNNLPNPPDNRQETGAARGQEFVPYEEESVCATSRSSPFGVLSLVEAFPIRSSAQVQKCWNVETVNMYATIPG